jgi:hypothetical protein
VTDPRSWFDLITAALVFGLSIWGIARRCHRLVRLNQIVLVEPIHEYDVEYLGSIKRSTYLRLGAKVVLLIGSLIMLFQLPLFEVWRIGLVLLLVFMNLETASVDKIRERLARSGAMS